MRTALASAAFMGLVLVGTEMVGSAAPVGHGQAGHGDPVAAAELAAALQSTFATPRQVRVEPLTGNAQLTVNVEIVDGHTHLAWSLGAGVPGGVWMQGDDVFVQLDLLGPLFVEADGQRLPSREELRAMLGGSVSDTDEALVRRTLETGWQRIEAGDTGSAAPSVTRASGSNGDVIFTIESPRGAIGLSVVELLAGVRISSDTPVTITVRGGEVVEAVTDQLRVSLLQEPGQLPAGGPGTDVASMTQDDLAALASRDALTRVEGFLTSLLPSADVLLVQLDDYAAAQEAVLADTGSYTDQLDVLTSHGFDQAVFSLVRSCVTATGDGWGMLIGGDDIFFLDSTMDAPVAFADRLEGGNVLDEMICRPI